MGLKKWYEVIEEDFPDFGPVTEETVENTMEMSRRYGGPVRFATGRIWTDEAYEKRRERVLSTPLP